MTLRAESIAACSRAVNDSIEFEGSFVRNILACKICITACLTGLFYRQKKNMLHAKNNLCILILSLCSYCSIFAGYAEQVLIDSPIAWWRLNEVEYRDGLPVTDEMGNISCAVFDGDGMTVSAGIDDRCGWFNGNLAGIDLGNALGPLLDRSPAVTIEAWIRNSCLVGAAIQRIFATRIEQGRAGIDIGLYSPGDTVSTLKVGARSSNLDSYLTVGTEFSAINQWTHLVCVVNYAQDNISIYLNGTLAISRTVDFHSCSYTYGGNPAQRDQIGRSPDNQNHFRGCIDELAIYTKALRPDQIQRHYSSQSPQEPAPLWISQIGYSDPATGKMIGSPCICKSTNGDILASYGYRGDTYVKISHDNGQTWQSRSHINKFAMASLFEHKGEVYLFGLSQNPGHICITKTSDHGMHWTDSTILFRAEEPGKFGYHTGPVPVISANGRIYRVFERRVTDERWPIAYAAVVVSADENADLLNPNNWAMTNAILFDPSWVKASWNCTSPGWLEGNAVQAPDGSVVVLMRVHTNPVVDKAAILTLSSDSKTLSYNPSTGLIDMPGGMHKFDIHRDPVTGKYLSLVNNNTDPSRTAQRNTLSLIASEDLIHWSHIRTIIQDDSPLTWEGSLLNVGFQYVVWQFDGKDIIFISRTAYDGAMNYHDSNRITFHRLNDYLNVIEPCGNWGYYQMDLDHDCWVDNGDLFDIAQKWIDIYDMSDFLKLAEQWLCCTLPYGQGCVLL